MEGVESKQVSWFQWKTKKEKRILLNNKEKEVSFITKESVSGSIMQLCKEFCQNMTIHKRHVYNINSQFKHFEKIKHNLKRNEKLVHIDFAQNYLGKLHTEVQTGHGKGVPDAIGSAVKQAADRLVKYGHDIINAADLVKHVGANGTETKLYEIPVDKIDKNENIIPNLKAVPGTMKLHQIQVCQESPSTISYRDVSCGCDGAFCDNCWKVHSLEKNQHTKGLKHEACVCVLNYSCSVKENIVLSPSYKLDTAAALHTLHLCDSFGLLWHECEALQIHLEPLTGRQRSLSGDKLTLNTFSSELIPTDAQDKTLFAVKVRADGDCLPGSGSVFAYGNDQMSEEIRLRIIVESVLNYSKFRGQKPFAQIDLAKSSEL
ncbi:hypothetical protein RRG08_040359 [Elysia crispata]|uniref:Uncharacterized protein n=1 Tax=Elysia crispata TaxID=231223 RepID=A0AAE0YSF0_9GAST|nr:hypothetical protein RRG08_040359 [Elysia crispata]